MNLFRNGCCCMALMLSATIIVLLFIIPIAVSVTPAFSVGIEVINCLDGTDPVFVTAGITAIIVLVIILCCTFKDRKGSKCYIFLCVVIFALYVLRKMRGYCGALKVKEKKGSKIIFICPYKSTTTVVGWQRVILHKIIDLSNGDHIEDSPIKDRVAIVGDHKAGEYNLQLSDLQKSDEGLYRCIVGNQDKFYKLELLDLDHNQDHVEEIGLVKNASRSVPTVQIKKKQYVVRPGMTETLECTFNSTSPVTQVFWERTNDGTKTIIPITTDQEKNLGSTPRIPSLTIRDIEKSDAGTYRCVATNSAGNGYSSATKLIVTESSGVIAIYGIKDSKIIFVCPYKSTTSTSVLWSCDDTEISDGPKIADSQRKDRVSIVGDHKAGVYNLELSGLQEFDEGVYRCKVGLQKQEYILKVVGSDDPVINSPKGSSVMFACPYQSTGTSTRVLWSRVFYGRVSEISDGPKIADSQMKDRVSIVGDHKAGVYSLELSGLQESDEGVYICSVGKQKQEYKLKVVAGEKHNK